MDPATWGYVAFAMSAVSGGIAAYSAHETGVAQAQANAYSAAVARNNQEIANQYATAELQKGAVMEQTKRQETAQREGAIRAAAGASGLDVNTGSPLRLQTDTAMLGEEDALTIRNNAERAAYGYRTEGLNYAARAQMNDMAGENALRSGSLGMWSSIIGAASSTSSRWAGFKQAGVSTPMFE